MPGNPLTDPKWADEMTDTVVTTVRTIREKTTVPLIYAARGVVFGLLAAILGIFAAVLLILTLLRGLQALLDRTRHRTSGWNSRRVGANDICRSLRLDGKVRLKARFLSLLNDRLRHNVQSKYSRDTIKVDGVTILQQCRLVNAFAVQISPVNAVQIFDKELVATTEDAGMTT